MKGSKLIIPKILNFVALFYSANPPERGGDSPGREFSIFNSRRGAGFTPLHSESLNLQPGDEWQINPVSSPLINEYCLKKKALTKETSNGVKIRSSEKPCPLGRGVTGFTLLEVMISLAIIGGLLITLIYTLNYHISVIEKHEAVTIASLLAREKITEGRRLLENKKGAFPEPYSAYSYETSIRESSSPGISEISVAVKRDRDEVRFSELVMNPK